MEKKLVTEAERFLNSRHQNKRRTQIIRGLALLVVVATISALIMPAVTMSNEVECGLEEHIHTEACYEVQQVVPEPVLTCTAGASGETVLHTHDEYCYDSQGNLICTLPEVEAHTHDAECYQERRTLLCEETADLGHEHSASCYSYVRAENVEETEPAAPTVIEENVCGLEEGEGAHQHTDECYPEERAAEPLCGLEETGDQYDDEGNLIQQGHTHTRECWYTRVQEKLVCGQEEVKPEYDEEGNLVREGHSHTDSCWLRGDALCEAEGCRQQVSAGHVHTDACVVRTEVQPEVRTDAQGEDWVQTLICGEEEREAGHVHTDECYEITQVLACRKQEIQAHAHSESCYDEDGALTCEKTEAAVHQHTDACFTAPEGGPEPTKVLTCGQEEHTHTDLCYVKSEPAGEKYYCNMEEHTHEPECYFSSGTLKCTIPEHAHTDKCLTPPSEETIEENEVEVKLDETFAHDTDLFHIEISVTGTAVLRTYTAVMELDEPDVPMAQSPFLSGFLSLLTSFIEPASAASLDDELEIEEPEAGAAAPKLTAVPDGSEEPSGQGPVGEATQPEIRFTVDEVDLESNEVRTAVETALENEQTPFAALMLRGYSLDNAELDLSDCTVTGEVTMKPHAADALANLNDVSLAVENEEAGEEKTFPEKELVVAIAATEGESGEVLSEEFVESRSTVAELGSAAPVRVTLAMNAPTLLSMRTGEPEEYPEFTVQYWAYLDRPSKSGVKGLSFIDTSIGGNNNSEEAKLPQNGLGKTSDPGAKVAELLTLDSSGVVATEKVLTEIYKQVTGLNYDTVDKLNVGLLNQVENPLYDKGGQHYRLRRIEVTYPENYMFPDGTMLDPKTLPKQYPAESDTRESQVLEEAGYFDSLSFTNVLTNVSENVILVVDGTDFKMVYDSTYNEKVDYNAAFFDYDITDGPTGTYQGKPSYKLKSDGSGINSESNYSGDGSKLGVGNGNTRSRWEDETWTDSRNVTNVLNKANLTSRGVSLDSYGGCTFGLVSSVQNGVLQFSKNVDAPDLFGEREASVTGRYDYIDDHMLQFKRRGDTYTLSAVTNVEEEAKKYATELDRFKTEEGLTGNNFWPMDGKTDKDSESYKGQKDTMFGESAGEIFFDGKVATIGAGKGSAKEGNPESDDKKKHNAYFGMKFEMSFTLPKGYMGPLEYYFYGDDDMWVILDDTTVVCDIGGVHGSVGEYVDLWDYISEDDESAHTLKFYYTERGASGSSCWMQFTIPNAITLPTTSVRSVTQGLKIEKTVVSTNHADHEAEYEFELKLGQCLDGYTVRKYDADGIEIDKGQIVGNTNIKDATPYSFRLKEGQYIEIQRLPTSAVYEVRETTQFGEKDCQVSFTFNGTNVSASNQGYSGVVNTGVELVCVNNFTYQQYALPETGGGTRALWYTMACVPLLAAGCLWYKKKTCGEGGEDGR